MKITKVEAIPLRLPENDIKYKSTGVNEALIVKIYTDEGIIGIGESWTNAIMGKAIIDAPFAWSASSGLGRIIVGENPLDINRLYEKMYRESFYLGRRGLIIQCMAAIDIALWDIAGKYYGAPIHKLMGGAYRDTLRCYASDTFRPTPEETFESARKYREMGFTAAKYGWEPLGTNEKLDLDLVRAVREGMGSENEVMIDCGCCYDTKTAVRRAKQFEEYNIYWLEEPVDNDNLEGYRRVASGTNTRVAGGEGNNGLWQYKNFIDNSNADVIQIDLADNGITIGKRIAEYAELNHKQVCNHYYSTPINLAAGIQFCAAIKNVEFLEYCVELGPIQDSLINEDISAVNGFCKVGNAPGLGITLNEDTVEKYRVKDYILR